MLEKAGDRIASLSSEVHRSVVSVGGYLATVSGRTTCAPCKADWPSMASVLTSVARRLSATVQWSGPANVWTCACTLVDNYSMAWQIKV